MNRKKKHIISRVSGITLLAVLALFINLYKSPQEKETTNDTVLTDVMEVHFIDVGQGDAILIEFEDAAMLIDAGENNKGTVVLNYLKAQNITNLDYVIGTHPHSDHIGGLDTLLDSLPVDKIIMPAVSYTTKTFEDVLDAIEDNDLKITKAEVGDEYTLGSATFIIVAPNASSYDEMNNYSIGIKLSFGKNSFLFTGDAESLSEEEMLKNGIDLTADVLKLAHHGSTSSSSDAFLDAVDPSYAVINVGKDNEYGHPHAQTLQSMKEREIKVYRTDVQGSVVFTTDGSTISVNTEDYKMKDSDLEN
jgi:competence protein ComEC